MTSQVTFRSSSMPLSVKTGDMGWGALWSSESDGIPFESWLHHWAVLFKLYSFCLPFENILG